MDVVNEVMPTNRERVEETMQPGPVKYSSRADLLAMSSSAAWQEAAVHRTAGLAGQLNIETVAPA